MSVVKIIPRRPFDDNHDAMPNGYLESDVDWFLNNRDVVLAWMESQVEDGGKQG